MSDPGWSMFRSAEALLRPRSVAIVGASETGGGGRAKRIFDRFLLAGFPNPVYLVNPNREQLWGQRVYPNFAAIPGPVDLALVIIPAPTVHASIADAVENGVKCALIYAAHFGEDGDAEGLARTRAIKAICETRDFRVSGPNCLGSLSIREKLPSFSLPRVQSLKPGPLGVVFQSSGTLQFWLEQAGVRGLGVSYAISSGNELDLDLADYINFLVEDDDTKLIACYVEGVRRPDAFMAVAEKALAARKPILLIKTGKSEAGREAAKTHTGALGGDDSVFDAVCAQYGITRCFTLDDLIEACVAFKPGRFPQGPRVAMAGYSGGLKGQFLDYASDEKLQLARFGQGTQSTLVGQIYEGLAATNPLDSGADMASNLRKFGEICRIVCDDPDVNVLMMQGHIPTLPNEPVDATVYAQLQASTDKPVIVFNRMAQNISEAGRRFQEEAGVPFLQGVPQAMRAIKGLIGYGATLQRKRQPLPSPHGKAENLEPRALDRLLGAHGLVPPRNTRAKSPEEAAKMATEIGFPVAVKVISPQASHKTEVGGVALNLADAEAVRAASEAMAKRLAVHDPSAKIEGFLVQEMVCGLELILGVREDPQFGPFLVAGLGGVFVEVLKDLAIRLLPVDEAIAGEMLASLRAQALFGSWRGQAPRDIGAAVRAMAGLSHLFLDYREVLSDLEINPLVVLAEGQGVRAVDVRMVRHPV